MSNRLLSKLHLPVKIVYCFFVLKKMRARISEWALRVDARGGDPPRDASPAGRRAHEQPLASDRKAKVHPQESPHG